MSKHSSTMCMAACLMLASGAVAGAADLPDNYLVGHWTTGGAEACGKPESEVTDFRADGTFTTMRNGHASAVGFWMLTNDDQLEMQVLAHDSLHPALEAIPGDYGYFVVHALLFDQTDNSHRMVLSIGDVLQGANVVRCP